MSEAPFGRWWERGAALVAIASFWPWILGWPHPVWRMLMYGMLAVMAILLVVNVRRLWRMGHPPESEDDA